MCAKKVTHNFLELFSQLVQMVSFNWKHYFYINLYISHTRILCINNNTFINNYEKTFESLDFIMKVQLLNQL